MAYSSQLITLDIGLNKAEPIHFVQGEQGRLIGFNAINSMLVDADGEPLHVNPTDFDEIRIHILKPDGNFIDDVCDIDDNIIIYELDEQCCIAGGAGKYDVSFIDGEDVVIYTAHGDYMGDFRAIEDSDINSVSIAQGIPFPDGFQEKLIAGSNITIVDNVISSTGGGGSSDYNDLSNKPSINSVTLSGNKSLEDLGITDTTYTAGANIQISATNEISATDTTYTAGTGLDLTGTTFSLDADASDISYDNTASGLTATDVQDAIDEVVDDIDTINNKLVNLPNIQIDTNVSAEVINGVLIFSCESYSLSTANTWITLYTLPAGYKPIKNMYAAGASTSGAVCVFFIGTTGLIQIRSSSISVFAGSICVPVATS